MIFRTVCCAIALGAMTATPLVAYDRLKEDFTVCTQGQGRSTNSDIVAACSRLIENAKAENETVGFFYAFRADAGSDKAAKCRDARKALELGKDPAFVNGAKTLIQQNC